jgi:hypothetical protein
MKAVQTIRRIGFSRWYERELLSSHAHLVLLLLCTLGLLGSFEAFSKDADVGSRLVLAACALASAVIGLWSLRRYLYLLKHAEYVADQAVCGGCQTYAKWDLLKEEEPQRRMEVCCRRCGQRWHISL